MSANQSILSLIPMSAAEQQRRRGFPRPVFAGDLAKSSSGIQRPVRDTRPVPSARPSGNLVEAPYRGWDSTGLNTYPIPRYDQQQLALFSKFILRDPNAEPYNDLVSRAQANIRQRHPQYAQPPVNIKQRYRGALGGKTNMSPKATGDNGLPDPYVPLY